MLGVLAYGEVEFWLSLIKVISITIFFIVAIVISAGGIGGEKIGFKYWKDPGAFADGINGVAKTFVIAGTLYAGTEMVGVAAGEAGNPSKAVPRAIKQVFWRILIVSDALCAGLRSWLSLTALWDGISFMCESFLS